MKLYFFFQAEDGIRDIGVTGVQPCAFPILGLTLQVDPPLVLAATVSLWTFGIAFATSRWALEALAFAKLRGGRVEWRSEERRVGKECRSRWSPDHLKKKDRRMM